jgi:methylated-DNA-[protein]-cysteine S-methyltransferase
MTVNLNKSKFATKIGVIYYLWSFEGSRAVVSYLGIGKEAFRRYMKKLENGSGGRDRVLLKNKKSLDIENKVLQYLEGRIKNLDLKMAFLSGTDFQKKIWKSTATVPYGKTASYKEVTENAGFSKAWRAAGSALKNNPMILLVPCHRVLNQDGKISYSLSGKETKRFLLELES